MTQKEAKIKFYYPYCKEEGCDGILSVKLNDDFSLDYKCDKNEKHQKKRIYCKAFERFYLQEKKIEICSNCQCDLENDKYKCSKCKKLYCCYCFKFDEHIKTNMDNLIITKKRCLIHKKDLVQYCFNCQKNLCIYCTKDKADKNPHHEHNVAYLYDMIPTEDDIEQLNYKIKKRKERYLELIDSLDEWEIKLYNKIEELKKNLMYEIEFMEKMFSNFNKYFMNYTYFTNFKYFKDYMCNTYSKKFDKCYTFDDLEDILRKLFKKDSIIKRLELKEMDLRESFTLNDGAITKITDEYFFSYSYSKDEVKISSIDKNGSTKTLEKTTIDFRRKICSATVSLHKNKIYACLANSRNVIFFNFDLENKLMEQSEYEIRDSEGGSRFNKCIEINEDMCATADSDNVIIWQKYGDEYIKTKKCCFNTETYDLLLVNNEFFVASQANQYTLTFIDIPNMKEDKIIKNIDSINYSNCMHLFQENIFVNCKEGIALINIETKELIQFIQNYDNNNIAKGNKRIATYIKDDDFYIYILNRLVSDYGKQKYYIKAMKFEDNYLKLTDKYEETEIDDGGRMDIIIMNPDIILIWGDKLYIHEI